MKVAIMQPYIFPYIGYFQLINAVDTFVFYDDVHFIKKGWISRNNILNNNNAILFSIPLKDASQNKLINEIVVSWDFKSKEKFLKTIETNYKKATYFEPVYSLVKEIVFCDVELISDLSIKSVLSVCNYLGIEKRIIKSSENYTSSIDLKKEFRLIDICKKEQAVTYLNPIGGQELYKKEDFLKEGIELLFIKSKEIKYRQFNSTFVPWLSIIDVLMFNSREETRLLLNNYELI